MIYLIFLLAFSAGWIAGAWHARKCALESLMKWCDEYGEQHAAEECERRITE